MAAHTAGGPYYPTFRRLVPSAAADRMCGGKNSEAGIAAVVGEEGSFVPAEGRLAVEGVDKIERFQADLVELMKAGGANCG